MRENLSMLPKVLLPFIAALAALLAAPIAPPQGARLDRTNLMVWRDDAGRTNAVRNVGEWRLRREEIVRGMESVMGRWPGAARRGPLSVRLEEEVDCGSYVRRLITYQSETNSRTPAYLLVPKVLLRGGRKAPAVLCLHPTDNQVGHKVVVGLGGKANRQYAAELAERGFVTLAPSYPLLANYQPDVKGLGSGTLKAVWDNSRGLDLLSELAYVDAARGFGAIGHSLGGHNSVYTAVFDERIRVVVSSCGLDSYTDYYDGDPKNWQPERGWCQTRYMLKLADYRGRLADIPFDFPEMIGALAPRVCFISAPLKDSNFRWRSVDQVAAAAAPVFKLHGKPDHLQVEHPDCDHDFPDAMRERAYKLFEQHLRAP